MRNGRENTFRIYVSTTTGDRHGRTGWKRERKDATEERMTRHASDDTEHVGAPAKINEKIILPNIINARKTFPARACACAAYLSAHSRPANVCNGTPVQVDMLYVCRVEMHAARIPIWINTCCTVLTHV